MKGGLFMALFSASQIDAINKVAAKSKEVLKPPKQQKASGIGAEIKESSDKVVSYFKDSPAVLVTTPEELEKVVDKCIEFGYAGIDTETTGLDRIRDTIVGFSLYCPGQPECYIPCKHIVPIFDQPYKDQMSYADAGRILSKFVRAKIRLIFANADFDLSMIYKDFGLDLIDVCYYDVILAWRCLKENEKDNALKVLYSKYVLQGKGDPMKFSDFFKPSLFPYSDPKVAKLYAANDAKITYELFEWQLPYVTKSNEKCKKHHLEKVADLVWNIEMPMIRVCAMLHRIGVYLDDEISDILHDRYTSKYNEEVVKLSTEVQKLIDVADLPNNSKRPFRTGKDFNPNSSIHVKYLVNQLLHVEGSSMDKETLAAIKHPATDQILAVRGAVKLLSTYVDKLPKVKAADNRIHAQFKSIGAATGRMASSDPKPCAYWGHKIKLTQGRTSVLLAVV